VVGQKPKRNSLTEISLMWALGVILLVWIFIGLRACGVTEILRRVYSYSPSNAMSSLYS
jgi:hypothetical protein